MSGRFASIWLSLASIFMLASSASGATPEIDDRAGLFSEDAVDKANQVLKRIYHDTSPHKDVTVETWPTLPGKVRAEALVEFRLRKRAVEGLLILVVKKPHKLLVNLGSETHEKFTKADTDHLRKLMIGHFAKSQYDEGLLDGLHFAEEALTRTFPAAKPEPPVSAEAPAKQEAPVKTEAPANPAKAEAPAARGSPAAAAVAIKEPAPAATQPAVAAARPAPKRPISPWIWIALGGLALWLGIAVIRTIRSPHLSSGSRYIGTASYGNWGGDWGKPFLAGLFGAAIGSWLYERFFNTRSNTMYENSTAFFTAFGEEYVPLKPSTASGGGQAGAASSSASANGVSNVPDSSREPSVSIDLSELEMVEAAESSPGTFSSARPSVPPSVPPISPSVPGPASKVSAGDEKTASTEPSPGTGAVAGNGVGNRRI